MMATFDALVIGGGPSGAAAAILLARAGWSVAVLEKASFPRHKVCGEFLSATNFPLLHRLGVDESFFALAGPEVTRVGLFAGDHIVTAAMPYPRTAETALHGCGRALGRERLDALMLDHATATGAKVWQPWSAVDLAKTGDRYLCSAVDKKSWLSRELVARVVIAAHGSWEAGPLPTQHARRVSRDSDLFAFKAHFLDSQLPEDLMPLLVFPGGYGGMVHSDQGRVSLSCCIRRDQLGRIRRSAGPVRAGAAVLAHINQSCRGVRDALGTAKLEHEWLSAGPIRPGVRQRSIHGALLVGNAAGEAHPIIAEGIGMAMQSSWELCNRLVTEPIEDLSCEIADEASRDYTAAWRRTVESRIRAGALIAGWAMKPAAVALALPMLRLVPEALTAGAWMTGKVAAA
jgi:menaquinone-9 beta-reductase